MHIDAYSIFKAYIYNRQYQINLHINDLMLLQDMNEGKNNSTMLALCNSSGYFEDDTKRMCGVICSQ